MKYHLNKDEYILLKNRLKELAPDIGVKLIVEDFNPYKLKFSEKIPCIVELVAPEERIEEIIEEMKFIPFL